MADFGARLKHAWNAFTNPEEKTQWDLGSSYTTRPDRVRSYISNERSIVTSIYNRISVDSASIAIRHVRLDDNSRFIEEINSGLNNCFTLEANIDQAARAFRQDIVMTLLEKGVAAVIPVDTTFNPNTTGSYDIKTLRVGDIVQWYPKHVRVSLYNDRTGLREEIVLEKRLVAIIENPLYSVMNEPNSTLQRLLRKLTLLDSVDEASSSGKLDIIIQLPYVIKSEARRQQAEQRRQDIEFQLKGSQYGIAYTDGTEKITQLNRPAENNLMQQVEYLTNLLFGQLGLTPEIMNGTADEKAMLNYTNRTLEPILTSITESLKRTFLTKTALSQKQSIEFFREPFKLVPISDIAEIADKFTRNEILSSNEIRQIVGFKPAGDPKADKLVNSNMPQSELSNDEVVDQSESDSTMMNDAFDEMDSALDQVFKDLGVSDEEDSTEAPLMQDAFDEMDSALDQVFKDLGVD
ncbi:MAG TPA: phage portal protein [Saccharofermentans sp.]|nr:phage portal protein [Saccharofermentans sp.]